MATATATAAAAAGRTIQRREDRKSFQRVARCTMHILSKGVELLKNLHIHKCTSKKINIDLSRYLMFMKLVETLRQILKPTVYSELDNLSDLK
ncbi:hypothetical protein V1478_012429 [Vespula squamosa]|uniref:Uncharacterized protein n=1 Tax=Vespula squamosa TaxID=30214 RepID=A0ABD2AD85_VESSQ